MLDLINIYAVLAAALCGFVWGWLWYSPTLFMNPWLKAHGKTKNDATINKTGSIFVMVYSFATMAATAFALSVIYFLADVSTLLEYMQIAVFICFGFIITTKFSDMLYSLNGPHWGKQAQIRFLIDSGFYLGQFLIAGAVLWYLA